MKKLKAKNKTDRKGEYRRKLPLKIKEVCGGCGADIVLAAQVSGLEFGSSEPT